MQGPCCEPTLASPHTLSVLTLLTRVTETGRGGAAGLGSAQVCSSAGETPPVHCAGGRRLYQSSVP